MYFSHNGRQMIARGARRLMFAIRAQKLDLGPITFDTFHSAAPADKVKEKGPSRADERKS
jgi:hypothetical protein